MNLTTEEEKFILMKRAERLEFGEIHFVVYYQHFKESRMVVERIIKSKMVKEK